MLEEMKSASDLGFEEGATFVYKWGNPHKSFSYGDVLTLTNDDGSASPRFKCEATGKSAYCALSMLESTTSVESGSGEDHSLDEASQSPPQGPELFSITLGDVTAYYPSSHHLLKAVESFEGEESDWMQRWADVVMNTRTNRIIKHRKLNVTQN